MSSDPRATPTLLPCPFCGGKAVVERYGNSRQSSIYRCVACGCGLETGEISGYGRIWNNRVPAPPNAIRGAVEGEREACAALVAAYGIEGMPFDVGSWTPGAVAAAIRARGEEKGK